MSAYAVAHIVHLFCAIAFVGGVFFETLVLSVLHSRRVGRDARREVEKALSHRAVRVMPWVVGALFLSGLAMLHRYAPLLAAPWQNGSFALQLAVKILLAASILLHFIVAVTKMRRGTLTPAWSKYIHTAVLLHMIAIVLLAKTMFYISW